MFCRKKHFNVDYFRKLREDDKDWNDLVTKHTVFLENIKGTMYGICRMITPVQDFGTIDPKVGNIAEVIEAQEKEVVQDGFYVYKITRRGMCKWITYHVFADLNSAIQAIDYFTSDQFVLKRATLIVRHVHHLQLLASFMCFHENGAKFMCLCIDQMPLRVLKRIERGAMFYAQVNVDAPMEKYLVAEDFEVTSKSPLRGRDIRGRYEL